MIVSISSLVLKGFWMRAKAAGFFVVVSPVIVLSVKKAIREPLISMRAWKSPELTQPNLS